VETCSPERESVTPYGLGTASNLQRFGFLFFQISTIPQINIGLHENTAV